MSGNIVREAHGQIIKYVVGQMLLDKKMHELFVSSMIEQFTKGSISLEILENLEEESSRWIAEYFLKPSK